MWTDDTDRDTVHAAEIQCLSNMSTNHGNFAEFSLSRLLMCLLSFLQPNVQVNMICIGEVSQNQAGLMFPGVHSRSNM
jgi:hypothetical protein